MYPSKSHIFNVSWSFLYNLLVKVILIYDVAHCLFTCIMYLYIFSLGFFFFFSSLGNYLILINIYYIYDCHNNLTFLQKKIILPSPNE